MKKISVLMLMLFTLFMLSACDNGGNIQAVQAPHPPEQSGNPSTRTVEASNIAAGLRANTTTFETALFSAMPTGENYMISPFSLRMALAMAANGAYGVTQAEILTALGIDDLDLFNQVAAAFIKNANANELVEFNVANSIWLNEDLFDCDVDFTYDFKRIITEYFAGAAEGVCAVFGADRVNAWISQQTNNRINDVVADDVFSPENMTLALLVNAIYFNGNWAYQFDPMLTRDDIFTDRNGSESTILFMEQRGNFSYYENDYFRMLAKPYEDKNIRMYFVLPRGDERLPFGMFEDAIDNMRTAYVRFRLPRFTTEFLHDNLVGILQGMGVIDAFRWQYANFIDMFTELPGDWRAYIGDILQKTFIEVDEEGTEAAAATVIEMRVYRSASPPPQPIPFYCNVPFIYFIRNDATGDILFMGEFAFAE